MTILPPYEFKDEVSVLDYYLAAIRTVISSDNESFIRKHCPLIPSTLHRFSACLKHASDLEIAEYYTSLVGELALCFEDFRNFRNTTAAAICISLRLQRHLQGRLVVAKTPVIR